MPFPWAAAIGAGASIYGALKDKKGKGKDYRSDIRTTVDRYRGYKPEGWLTPQDYAESERFRSRRSASVGALGRQHKAQAVQRYATRGLGGSPASEATYRQIGRGEGEAVENIGREAESMLYGTRMGRERFDQGRLMASFGAEIGGLSKAYDMDAARDAAFWNSMSDLIGAGSAFFGGAPGGNLPSGVSTFGSEGAGQGVPTFM